jgi:glutamate synthase (NADPH/NADH) large chain
MFVVDIEQGRIISDTELKQTICSQKPYAEWLNKYKIRLEELPEPRVMFTDLHHEQVQLYQKAFGYSKEDLEVIIAPMAIDGKEPIGSMGSDVPLAVLSDQPQHISSYFKQLFAQVTNPPIDPIRERMVMSLAAFVGNNGNLLNEDPLACHSVALKHPVLTNYEIEKLRSIDTGIFQAKTLQCYFNANGKPGSLKKGLDRLCRYAVDAVEDGFEVIILSDRAIDSEHAPDTVPAGHRCCSSPPYPQRPAWTGWHCGRSRRCVGSASFCYVDRLWCYGDQSLPSTALH